MPEIRRLVFCSGRRARPSEEAVAELVGGRAVLEWAYREKKVVQGARRGDILVKRPARHVGLVLTAPENGTFSSVEGNTYTSDREKEGVYIVRRLKVENYLFVRL